MSMNDHKNTEGLYLRTANKFQWISEFTNRNSWTMSINSSLDALLCIAFLDALWSCAPWGGHLLFQPPFLFYVTLHTFPWETSPLPHLHSSWYFCSLRPRDGHATQARQRGTSSLRMSLELSDRTETFWKLIHADTDIYKRRSFGSSICIHICSGSRPGFFPHYQPLSIIPLDSSLLELARVSFYWFWPKDLY